LELDNRRHKDLDNDDGIKDGVTTISSPVSDPHAFDSMRPK